MVDADDLPPEPSLDIAPLVCAYEGCTNGLTKPARGRTPKFCDEHKKTGSTPSGKRAANWPMASTVESVLIKYLNGLGGAVSFINPVDGSLIASGAENVAHEVVELARADKKLKAFLEKIATPGKYGGVALAVAPIVIGILVNHNILPQFILGGTDTGKGV